MICLDWHPQLDNTLNTNNAGARGKLDFWTTTSMNIITRESEQYRREQGGRIRSWRMHSRRWVRLFRSWDTLLAGSDAEHASSLLILVLNPDHEFPFSFVLVFGGYHVVYIYPPLEQTQDISLISSV